MDRAADCSAILSIVMEHTGSLIFFHDCYIETLLKEHCSQSSLSAQNTTRESTNIFQGDLLSLILSTIRTCVVQHNYHTIHTSISQYQDHTHFIAFAYPCEYTQMSLPLVLYHPIRVIVQPISCTKCQTTKVFHSSHCILHSIIH